MSDNSDWAIETAVDLVGKSQTEIADALRYAHKSGYNEGYTDGQAWLSKPAEKNFATMRAEGMEPKPTPGE